MPRIVNDPFAPEVARAAFRTVVGIAAALADGTCDLCAINAPRHIRRRKVGMSKVTGNDSKGTLYCSFCGKSQHEVRKLIAGPTVFICDECVELCKDIIQEEK